MAKKTVFYSWQSDLPNGTNRSFIENCLAKAIKELRVSQPQLDPCLDRDTANVPGSPDISATILDKIDNCHIFVCDVSIVHAGERPTPNPNVLFELGYAVKRLGWDRVICVCNEHFGDVKCLPFDVSKRRVKRYTLSPEETDRSETAKALGSALQSELELILTTSHEEGERLHLQFGDVETKTPLGQSLEHTAVFYSCDLEAIPDYAFDDRGGPFGDVAVRIGRPNRDYHRQLARYVQQSAMVRKIAFVVFNAGQKAINDVNLEIVFTKSHGLVILDEKPVAPAQSDLDARIRGINPITSYFPKPGRVTVNELPDRYEVQVQFGKLQAEANGWSEPLYIGASESCNLEATAVLFGDELTAPRQVGLRVALTVTEMPMDKLSNEDWARLLQAE